MTARYPCPTCGGLVRGTIIRSAAHPSFESWQLTGDIEKAFLPRLRYRSNRTLGSFDHHWLAGMQDVFSALGRVPEKEMLGGMIAVIERGDSLEAFFEDV